MTTDQPTNILAIVDDSPTNSSNSLHHLAIEAALESRWEDALKLNAQIIETDSNNVDALNRTARAHLEMGNLSQALKYYSQVIKNDPYNPIAQKNIKIIKSFKKVGDGQEPMHSNTSITPTRISPSMFLQEPGKTKVVNLLKVAEPQKLSLVYCGMPVEMNIKNRGITISDMNGKYLGVLPDDLSYQIIRLIKGGNKYEAVIKAVKVNGLTLLIRETFRNKKFRNQPSFLDNHNYQSNDMLTSYSSLEGEDSSDEETSEEEQAV